MLSSSASWQSALILVSSMTFADRLRSSVILPLTVFSTRFLQYCFSVNESAEWPPYWVLPECRVHPRPRPAFGLAYRGQFVFTNYGEF